MRRLTRQMRCRLLGIVTVFQFMAGVSVGAHSRGIYVSRTDAEVRAKEIGCITVHQNNGKWMPCSDERELHRQLRKQ